MLSMDNSRFLKQNQLFTEYFSAQMLPTSMNYDPTPVQNGLVYIHIYWEI